MPPKNLLRSLVLVSALLGIRVAAVTRLASADGQFWDIQDTSPWAQDSGGIATGGRANPFNGFGYLKIRVRAGGPALRARSSRTNTCAASGSHTTAPSASTRSRRWSRAASSFRARIYAPKDTNYLRYLDRFTNTTQAVRAIDVAWGGAAGAFSDGGQVTVAATSSGDRRIDLTDTFVTVMQNAREVPDPARGPSGHGPSAHVLGSHAAGQLTAIGDMYANPFIDRYPGYDPAHIGYVFTLRIAPGQTVALMTFVVKGLSEIYDPRGGFPIPIRDGIVAPKFSEPYASPDARDSGARIRNREGDRDRTPSRRRTRPARPDCQAARRRSSTGASARAHRHRPSRVVEKTAPQIAGCAHARRGDDGGHRLRVPDAALDSRPSRAGASIDARVEPFRRCRGAAARRRARGRPRARSAARHPDRIQRQHRRPRPAHDRRVAGARRSPAAARLAGCRRHAQGRRGRPRQDEPRRVPVRRFRHQLGRRHDWQRLRSDAQHGRLERRHGCRCVVESRGARVRHRHVQLAVESGVVRVAGDDPHDARADEPRGRDAAEHLQRRRRSDREVGSRAGAGARRGHRQRRRRRSDRRCGSAHQGLVPAGPRPGRFERRADRRDAAAVRRRHRRARSSGGHGTGDCGAEGGGR